MLAALFYGRWKILGIYKMLDKINAKDVDILALFAQCGKDSLSKNMKNKLMKSLSCSKARKIARHIISKNVKNKIAKAFIDWASSLKPSRDFQ